MSLKYTGNQTERLYSPELNNMANVSNNAILEGCTPSPNTGADMNIKVASGELFFGLNRYEISASGAVAVTSNTTSFSRIDTILINSAGTVSVLAGIAGAIPKPADYNPSLFIALGLITVTPGATAITSLMFKDIRVLNIGGSGGSGAIATVNVYREAFTSQTSVAVIHGLDDYYPTVQVYDSSGLQITPDGIELTGDDTLTVTFNVSTSGTIVVMGGKAGVSIGVNKYHEEFTSQTALTVTHSLNDSYPTVQVYNASGELILADVTITDANTVDLAFASSESGHVVVHGGITGEGSVISAPGAVTDADFVQFDGVSGGVVKDGLALQTTITDDDTKVPSSGAVVDYTIPGTYLETTITDSDTKVPSSGAVVDYNTTLAVSAFKVSNSSYTDNDTSQTFTDAFCTAASLVTVSITSATLPQGVWSVESGAGSFTITSTVAESADITFDYYIQKVAI